jgi:hypothetical protein
MPDFDAGHVGDGVQGTGRQNAGSKPQVPGAEAVFRHLQTIATIPAAIKPISALKTVPIRKPRKWKK